MLLNYFFYNFLAPLNFIEYVTLTKQERITLKSSAILFLTLYDRVVFQTREYGDLSIYTV